MFTHCLATMLAFVMSSSFAYAFDLKLLENNKETVSRMIDESSALQMEEWRSSFGDQQLLRLNAAKVLEDSLDEFNERSALCDIGLYQLLLQTAVKQNLLQSENMQDFLVYLRVENLIDDLFYQNLKNSGDLSKQFSSAANTFPRAPFNLYTKKNRNIDVGKLYAGFSEWPDEITKCSLGTYNVLSHNLKWKNSRDRSHQLKRLNYLAYAEEVISLETYNKLEAIRKADALDWPVYVSGYLEIVVNAKDKLTESGKPEYDPAAFSTEYALRKEKLTQRGRLYKIYDSTQIIMLAEVIQKISARRDSWQMTLNTQFNEDPSAEDEIYILSPMEKNRVALRRLLMDLGELKRSDHFRGVNIQYEDLVAAAYETGFLKSEELEYILRYEDFWNPKSPKWKTYANFAFSVVGTAAFYLPPPWNVVGAIALVVTQSKVIKNKKKPNPEDSWNTIL